MALCTLKPLVSALNWFIICPIASPLAGRIDDTGNMATPTQGKAHRTVDKLCDAPGRLPGDNMVLLGTNGIDILANLAEVNGYPFQDKLVWFDEIVFIVGITQVVCMRSSSHTCTIGIPVKQIKSRWLFAQQVIIYNVTPDQVV